MVFILAETLSTEEMAKERIITLFQYYGVAALLHMEITRL